MSPTTPGRLLYRDDLSARAAFTVLCWGSENGVPNIQAYLELADGYAWAWRKLIAGVKKFHASSRGATMKNES